MPGLKGYILILFFLVSLLVMLIKFECAGLVGLILVLFFLVSLLIMLIKFGWNGYDNDHDGRI